MGKLRELGESLWCFDFNRMTGKLALGTRTTVARLPDGGLFLHSPGPMEAPEWEALAKLGDVKHIVAPNTFHHLFVLRASARFPNARVWGAPGLAEKSKAKFHETLGATAPPAWKSQLEQHLVGGIPKVNEVVFFHRPSRTLLLTDLAFNVRHSDSFLTRLILRLNSVRGGGGYGRFGPTRVSKLFTKDKKELRSSIDTILGWDFDRIIVTHGDVVDTGGKETFRRSFSWLPAA